MYIVDSGKLHVLNEEGGDTSVLATLTSGAYFGEISLLNMTEAAVDENVEVFGPTNRRTASVISVGYTHLLRLSKEDINEVLEDYPLARERLKDIARKRLIERNQFKIIRRQQRDQQHHQLNNSVTATRGSNASSQPMVDAQRVAQQRKMSRLIVCDENSSGSSENDQPTPTATLPLATAAGGVHGQPRYSVRSYGAAV